MNAETQQSISRAPAPVLVPPASFALAGAGSAPRPHTADAAPRVVIVGAGFAGLTAAQALKGAPVQVILIDRRNHHLFQPLLYQVATAGLSPADVAVPTRGILRRQHNAKTLLGEVTGVDKEAREVLVGDRRVAFIIATGATHAYFGHDEWEPFAPGLKSLDDATAIRRRILLAFEKAESSDDPLERRRLGNFVVIGGGPTGVELSGAIAELANKALVKDFRNIDPRHARIILVEAGSRLLAPFPEKLSARAKRALERLGVEVRLGSPVTSCDAQGVMVGGERIDAETIIWAAGVAASPAAAWLGADKDRAGRVVVSADFSLANHPQIFVIGDTASAKDDAGKPLPGVAPAAKQEAHYVVKSILAQVAGRKAPGPFRYKDPGNLATIGRRAAVVDFGWLRISGFPAWLLWSAAHIYFLVGFRNRIVVSLDWLLAYFTFRRGARLITGAEGGV
jgi:NADH:ubiquinone reductase (H+-translocating)